MFNKSNFDPWPFNFLQLCVVEHIVEGGSWKEQLYAYSLDNQQENSLDYN